MAVARREDGCRALRLGVQCEFCPVITGRSVLARAWSPLQREALRPSTAPLLGPALSA